MSDNVNNILVILSSITFSAFAHVILRKGMKPISESESEAGLVEMALNVASNVWVIVGVGLHVLALAVWLVALSRVEVTFAYPFLAFGYVFVGLLAWTWLGEDLNPVRLVGMTVIVIGIIVVSRS